VNTPDLRRHEEVAEIIRLSSLQNPQRQVAVLSPRIPYDEAIAALLANRELGEPDHVLMNFCYTCQISVTRTSHCVTVYKKASKKNSLWLGAMKEYPNRG
jgi:hypothetical protein